MLLCCCGGGGGTPTCSCGGCTIPIAPLTVVWTYSNTGGGASSLTITLDQYLGACAEWDSTPVPQPSDYGGVYSIGGECPPAGCYVRIQLKCTSGGGFLLNAFSSGPPSDPLLSSCATLHCYTGGHGIGPDPGYSCSPLHLHIAQSTDFGATYDTFDVTYP